jgi:hypothetical protein
VYPNNNNNNNYYYYKDNNMFAYLRSNTGANYRFITQSIATNMRDHVRNQRLPLTGLDPSNANVAGILADIYMRELACAIKTLQQVNCVAVKYHEHAFDNTDAYIEGQMPTQTHEMNAEQRHAAQLLLGVGNIYSEINATLRVLDSQMLGGSVSFQSATECNPAMRAQLSQQFSVDASFVEDAFGRVQHITKQVWSLVNMLAFSNLFRFADHTMVLPTSEDSIFIPYIPIAKQAEEVQVEEEVQVQQTRHECNGHVCNEAEMNRKQQEQELFTQAAKLLADDKITPEQACSFIETLRDAGIIADDILDPEPEQEQQKGFNEIAGLFADWKITTEEACDLFAEWMTEWMVVASDS